MTGAESISDIDEEFANELVAHLKLEPIKKKELLVAFFRLNELVAQATGMTTVVDATTSEVCEDRSEHCAAWSRGGFCTDGSAGQHRTVQDNTGEHRMKVTMASMCKKSCELCVTTVVDVTSDASIN